jgi:flagellar biosynthesis/type III secretory pathway protein FliH
MRKDILNAKPETHESYGVLSISRVTGTPRPLFGSTIRHGDTITLKISEGKVYRDFQKNRYDDGKQFIEVEMSAAQFAEAITTLNVGCGVPVTLRHVNGKQIADPPSIDFKEQAKNELKEEMGELAERIEELAKDAKEILERKGSTIKAGEKEKLLKDLLFLTQEVRSNIPFAHQCFQEAVEETIVQAKAEVDSCLTSMRERLGQAALDNKIEVPLLEDKKTNDVKKLIDFAISIGAKEF